MPKPNSSSVSNQQASPPPVLGWVVVLAIVAFVVWGLRLGSSVIDEQRHDQQEQHDQVKPDDKKDVIDESDKKPPAPQPNTVAFKDCVLLVVCDKKSVNESIDYTITLQNDQFWKVTAPALVQKVEFLEDDDDIGKAAIAAAKLPAPVVLLFNAKTKKLVWSMPLPKGGTSEIEGKFK